MAANDSVTKAVGNAQPVINTAKVASAASTNATSVKAGAGKVYGYELFNGAAYAVFVKFYNKASAPVVGTDTPAFVVGIPAGERVAVPYDEDAAPSFDTGIAYAITKLAADSDTTAVAANDVVGGVFWR